MKVKLWSGFFLAFIFLPLAYAAPKVENLTIDSNAQSTLLSIDLNQDVKYKVFTLSNPNRVVIDLHQAKLTASLKNLDYSQSNIIDIRYAHRQDGYLRLVLDTQEAVRPKTTLNKMGNHIRRLVVELPHSGSTAKAQKSQIPSAPEKAQAPKVATKKVIEAKVPNRDFVIAIDPGHGGEDTGAIGNKIQLREKDVVFAVAKKLESLINSKKGMRAYLVRGGDYYIGLRKRMTLAREQGADLFISIHADSFKDSRASGASVYVLSEKGASNEAARWLAERENRSDLIGGVSLEDKGSVLASVLLDLSQTHSQHASNEFAMHLIQSLGRVTDMHHKSVQRAGFLVLKSPDIPSVLVELGFISNPVGERKLSNKLHQQQLAQALLAGIQSYASKRSLPQVHQEMNVASR